MDLVTVPQLILRKIAESVDVRRLPTTTALREYDASPTGRRHGARIRDYCGVHPYDAGVAAWLATVAEKASELKAGFPTSST